MSKIQEALRKVQKSAGLPDNVRPTVARENPEVPLETHRSTERLANGDTTMSVKALPADQIPEHLTEADARYGGHPRVIDTEQLVRNGFLASGVGQQKLADEFRQIKRPILANARGKRVVRPERANIVMVASAVPGEGKTFTCINLALSIAREEDWSVVLVDVDCAKQDITSMFDSVGSPGLLDLLKDPDLDPHDLIMPTNLPSLSILPAGTRDANATELLASDRMDQLIQKLSEDDPYRIVIMDSSPILLTTESIALSSSVGQIVLVVSAGHTSRGDVIAALEKLDGSKAINAILNRVEGRSRSSYGGYYDYYADRDHPIVEENAQA